MEKVKIADAGTCRNCKERIPRDIINIKEERKCPICGIVNPVEPLSVLEAVFGSIALVSGMAVVACAVGAVVIIWLIFVFWMNN